MENKIIAQTYQIIGQIGAGGGGIVYLAEHLRLGKKVVLKADKRVITTKTEMLRAEVDALKNLSHTYIPKVYDFIIEDETVYTVMDYIDGESFDRPLKRGIKYTSADITKWAKQLLEAVEYLHTRPPNGILHADIKPANIMLTSAGSISLIDFNIALVLGDEGAVAVGRSFGYASPEHYGETYKPQKLDNLKTDIEDDNATVLEETSKVSNSISNATTSSSSKRILLDARSDIYSLGATLYHMISGKRPAKSAVEVEKLKVEGYPKAILDIVNKAMEPNIDKRYQTASEMLKDINKLRKKDKRAKRFTRRVVVTVLLNIVMYTAGLGAIFLGLKQFEQIERVNALVEYAQNELEQGNNKGAIEIILETLPDERNILTPEDPIRAESILSEALGVYDLKDGYKKKFEIDLGANVFDIEISPNSETIAVIYAYEIALISVQSGEIIAKFETEETALSSVEYIDDNLVVLTTKDGVIIYNIENKAIETTFEVATTITVSKDKTKLATVYKRDEYANIYDINSRSKVKSVEFEEKTQTIAENDRFLNPQNNIFDLSDDGKYLAVSFSDGSVWCYNIEEEDSDLILLDETSGFYHFEGGISKQYFAFSATNEQMSMFAVVDIEELYQTGGFDTASAMHVLVKNDEFYIKTDNIFVEIDPYKGDQESKVTTFDEITAYDTIKTRSVISYDNVVEFYDKNAKMIEKHEFAFNVNLVKMAKEIAVIGSSDSNVVHILEYETKPQYDVMTYDSERIFDEARLTNTGAIAYSYDIFAIFDSEGKLIEEVEIEKAENVYDQQMRSKDEFDVIYDDGMVVTYETKTGEKISEIQGEKPDLSLVEYFETEMYKVESPLHGGAIVYDKNTNEEIMQIVEEAYLTYVTEVSEYIIIEYITISNYRYGKIYDQNFNVLATLPYLTDITNDELVFNYTGGVLKKTKIYTKNELIELAKNYK